MATTDYLYQATIAVTFVWLTLVVMIHLRRRASNLTPVHAAKRNRRLRPDFLKIDHRKRKAMIARGEAYERVLEAREAEAEEVAPGKKRRENAMSRLARLLSILMSVFTLATMIGSVIFNVNYLGDLLKDASTGERIQYIVTNHPIACAVAAGVIGFHIYSYIAGRKWRAAGQPVQQ